LRSTVEGRSARTSRRQGHVAANHLDLTDLGGDPPGLADVSFKLGDWAGARSASQKVLTALGEEETEARRVY
jgi:hypothetical protein